MDIAISHRRAVGDQEREQHCSARALPVGLAKLDAGNDPGFGDPGERARKQPLIVLVGRV